MLAIPVDVILKSKTIGLNALFVRMNEEYVYEIWKYKVQINSCFQCKHKRVIYIFDDIWKDL